MADAERLMNLMERFDYKSEQYKLCRQVLLSHLAKKPKHDEDVPEWAMTGPAPFEFEDVSPPPFAELEPEFVPEVTPAIPPEITPAVAQEPAPVAKAKKRTASKKKPSKAADKEPKKTASDKPKRVRKKTTVSKVVPSTPPAA
jgi:hypothetical protein